MPPSCHHPPRWSTLQRGGWYGILSNLPFAMWKTPAVAWAAAWLCASSLLSTAAGTQCPRIKVDVVGEGDTCTSADQVKRLVQDTGSANHTVRICGIPKGTSLMHSLECRDRKCAQFNSTISRKYLDVVQSFYGTSCDPDAQVPCGHAPSKFLQCTVGTSARSGVVDNVCAFAARSVPPREPCLFHEECSSDACHSDGLCALPRPGSQEECRTSADCASDHYCSSNACVRRKATGQSCSNGDSDFDQCLGDDFCASYPDGGTMCTAPNTVANGVRTCATPWLCESNTMTKAGPKDHDPWQCSDQSLVGRFGDACDPANATQPAGTECLCTPGGGVLVPLGILSADNAQVFSSFQAMLKTYAGAKQRCESRGAPSSTPSPWRNLVPFPCFAQRMDRRQMCALQELDRGGLETSARRHDVLLPQWRSALPAEARENFLAALSARTADQQMARCAETEAPTCSYTTPAGVRLCKPMPSHNGDHSRGFPPAAVAAIVVGCLLAVGAAFYFLYWRPRHSSPPPGDSSEPVPDPGTGDYVAYDVQE